MLLIFFPPPVSIENLLCVQRRLVCHVSFACAFMLPPCAGGETGFFVCAYAAQGVGGRGVRACGHDQRAFRSIQSLRRRRRRCRLPARFAPHLRVAHGCAVVRTAHALPSGAFGNLRHVPVAQSSCTALPCRALVSLSGCRSLSTFGGSRHRRHASSRRLRFRWFAHRNPP